MDWFINNIVGISGIAVGGFIAYHVYFLSKKLDIRDKLSHREQMKIAAMPILKSMEARGYSRKVELINVKKYEKHYPHNNDETREGYTYLGVELKTYRYDGIEFFCAMPQSVYQKEDGSLSLKKQSEDQKQSGIVYPVGLIPYEWIAYIDPNGDEFAWRPQFFTAFKGKNKSPYREIAYYQESDTYHEGSGPIDWKYRQIDVSLT